MTKKKRRRRRRSRKKKEVIGEWRVQNKNLEMRVHENVQIWQTECLKPLTSQKPSLAAIEANDSSWQWDGSASSRSWQQEQKAKPVEALAMRLIAYQLEQAQKVKPNEMIDSCQLDSQHERQLNNLYIYACMCVRVCVCVLHVYAGYVSSVCR